jgi:hypothetical protein
MLVEHFSEDRNEVVGEAYMIAANYLDKVGALPRSFVIHEPLLNLILKRFQQGHTNKIWLANKAISEYQKHTIIDV